MIVAELVPYTLLALAGAGVAARVRFLRARQRALDEAGARLAAAGFDVRPLTERYVNRAGGDASTDFELKHGLVASLGDSLQATIVAASPSFARGVIRRRGLELVRRATFTIAREGAATRAAHALGVDDIEIGDADLDATLAINGWPADLVRAIVAQPSVRGELAAMFAQDAVRELRAGASTEEGVLRVAWQFPWDQLDALRPLADVVERLARALDDARFVDPLAKAEVRGQSTGGVSPESGAPVPVPGSGRRP